MKLNVYGSCPHYLTDGAGHYCKLKNMTLDNDYPHEYWRVLCQGSLDHPYCIQTAKTIKNIRLTHQKTLKQYRQREILK